MLAMRDALALVAALAVAAGGAVILGEYELTGTTPYLAGVVFGLLIGEVVHAVGGRRTLPVAAGAAAVAAAGLLWAGWISSGEGVAPFPALAWVAAALAAVVAGWRTRPRRVARARAGGDPPPPDDAAPATDERR